MAERKYLDEVGLQTVANNVNTRLKTVTTMPSSATNGAVRLYVGNTGTYIKGHTYQYNSTSEEWNDITPITDISSKADKVVSATNGDLAELDSNGNLTDSGILSSNVVVKSNTTGLLKNDGTVDTNTYATTTALEDKADKVASATENDIATLNSSGNLTDSGINSNIFPSGATSSNKLATANDIPTELNDLSDDVVITTPVNNQILAYNGTSGKWENKTGQIVIGSAVFKGSILFANLPTTGMENGDWYDIKDAFVTDSTFEEGSGIACAAGTDVIWVSADNKWNILTPSGVYSFNGRTGAVVPASGDYTKSDVGLGNVVNTGDSSIPVNGGTTKFTTGGAYTELNKKTNKVNGSTNGDLAGLDGDGNLTDSGILGTDVIVKSNTAGLVKNDGTIDTSTYPNTFTGTQEQWNALTTAQKKEYEICNITDDIGTEVFYTKAESDATFATKVLSEPIEGVTTVEGALGALSNANQATRQLIDDTVGWESINVVNDKTGYTFVKSTARTTSFKVDADLVVGEKWIFSADVSAISGYTGTNALGVRLGSNPTISQDFNIPTNASGRITHEFTITTASGRTDENTKIYAYISNAEPNNATITLSNVMLTKAIYAGMPYQPYHASVEETLQDAQVIEQANLWDSNNVFSGYINNEANGQIYASSTGAKTIYQYLPAGQYTVKKITSSTFRLAQYTSAPAVGNTCISSTMVNVGSSAIEHTVTLANACYLAVTVSGSSDSANIQNILNSVKIAKGTDPQPLKYSKCDNSVIANVENGTTFSQAYSIGQHFTRHGAFCTLTANVAQNDTILDNTPAQFTAGDVAGALAFKYTIPSTDDLDNYKTNGIYNTVTAPSHSPENVGYNVVLVNRRNQNDVQQIVFHSGNGTIYCRNWNGVSWTGWYKFSGTLVE